MAKRPPASGSDFSARVERPPAKPASATPPPHQPRNQSGATNYQPSPHEAQLIERIRNPKAGISAYGRDVAENLVRRNLTTTEGMTATEIAILKRLALECGVTLELKASP